MGSCRSSCKRLLRQSEMKMETFEKGARIGFGASGSVFEVKTKRESCADEEGKLVLKIIRCKNEEQQKEIREKYEELSNIKSEGLVPFIGCFETG